MKILLTGGGSGGHFYPLITVAQYLRKLSEENKLLQPDIYFASDKPYDENLLMKNSIEFKKISAGKMRLYFSLENFFDIFKTLKGIFMSLGLVWRIYPDVVFTNGGYVAFPVLLAARILRIPVFVHVSDTVPGKVSRWSGKFAKKISLGFPEAEEYFDKEKTAFIGNPIRMGLETPLRHGAYEFLKLDENIPTILILGGSQGAKIINDVIVDILPSLLEKYQVIHQTGKNNITEVLNRTNLLLENSPYKNRYRPFKYLDLLALRMSAGASNLVISRAGSSLSEIASWGIPSIVIPITNSSGGHQRKNAFSYSHTGSAIVIMESNLTPNLLEMEIDRLLNDEDELERMREATKSFAKKASARIIAEEILKIGVKHEK